MTRYILVGGYTSRAPDGGQGLCQELIKGHPTPVKILYCLFASRKDSWNQTFLEGQEFFKQFMPEEDFVLELAIAEKFCEQVRYNDVIFIKGGDMEQLLINELSKDRKWIGELRGKTLAGSSAGADAMSKFYYDIENLTINEGLGVIPVKVIPHWKSDYNAPNVNWDRAYLELKGYKEDLPIYALGEGEYVIIEM